MTQRAQQVHMELAQSFYIVEVYSGNGSVAKVLSEVLGIPAITIDRDPKAKASITMDVLDWDQVSADAVRGMAGVTPGCPKRAIVWASPDCTQYSRSRTTSAPRDLAAADACVAVVRQMAADLDAAVVLIENPATGLLKDRDVISFMPYSYEVHYCQYGYSYRKPTMVWSSVKLRGFSPLRCPQYPACPSCYLHLHTGQCRHVSGVEVQGYSQRISVPDQLVNSIARCLQHLLPELGNKDKPPGQQQQQQQQQRKKQQMRKQQQKQQQQHRAETSEDDERQAAAADIDADIDIDKEIDVEDAAPTDDDDTAPDDDDATTDAGTFQVDYIGQAKLVRGVLMLQVHWVGYAAPSWEPESHLSADLSAYDFAAPAYRSHALALQRKLQSQQQQQQQQQQQRQQHGRYPVRQSRRRG